MLAAGPWASLLARAGPGRRARRLSARRGAAACGRPTRCRAFARRAGAILLPNSFEAALAAWYWGARRRVGFAGGGRSWLLTDARAACRRAASPPDRRVPDARSSAASRDVATREPTLTPPPPDCGRARRGAPRCSRRRARRRALAAARRRASRRRVRPGQALAARSGWRSSVDSLADAGDTPRAARRAERRGGRPATVAAQAPAASLVGRDRPALLPALLAELDVLVSGDTGVAHLAAALGTPVVTLFGPTDPRLTRAARPRVAVVTPSGAVRAVLLPHLPDRASLPARHLAERVYAETSCANRARRRRPMSAAIRATSTARRCASCTWPPTAGGRAAPIRSSGW